MASLVAWVLVAPVEGPEVACAATPLIAEVEAKAPPVEATRKLRAWLGYARGEALAAEHEGDTARCYALVRDLAARASEIEVVVGKATADRARAEAARLRAEEAARAEQGWRRRRGILIANVTASAFFSLVAVTLLTVPWIVSEVELRAQGDSNPVPGIISSAIGGPMLVAAAIPLGVWSVRLKRHRQQRPVVARLGGAGLRLEF